MSGWFAPEHVRDLGIEEHRAAVDVPLLAYEETCAALGFEPVATPPKKTVDSTVFSE